MADQLNRGESLERGQSLTSANGRYSLDMQEDGNLVLYAPGGVPTWASGTDGEGECSVSMQEDGNLVVYTLAGQAVWASRTDGEPECYLLLQDDGNLVVYAAGGRPVWNSGTHLRAMRIEVVDNGRPDRSQGNGFKNETGYTAIVSAGSLSINVLPGQTGYIAQLTQARPAIANVRAWSGGKLIQVGQIALDTNNAIEGGKHWALTHDGDVKPVEDNVAGSGV